jgi:hypothetical protein
MFSHPDYDGHEALLFAQDMASGLRALIAIHDTTLGPAFSGCRMYPYASEQHAMTDVLRLSGRSSARFGAAVWRNPDVIDGIRPRKLGSHWTLRWRRQS